QAGYGHRENKGQRLKRAQRRSRLPYHRRHRPPNGPRNRRIDQPLLRKTARVAEKFPLLQRDWYIAVFPYEIVEGAQIKFFALLHPLVGEEFYDLQFADLIGNGLTGAGCEGDRFLTPRL